MKSITRVQHGLLAAMALALCACAQTPPEPPAPVFKDSLETASAKVETVDPVTRLIALRPPQGERLWITAGPEVRNFAQIKVGDTVTVHYYKAIAAQVKPKGSTSLAPQGAVATYAAKPGERPAGAVAANPSSQLAPSLLSNFLLNVASARFALPQSLARLAI